VPNIHDWISSSLLTPLLDVIDAQIERLCAEIDLDPSLTDAWLDDVESLMGLGFVACQQFLVSTYRRFGDDKWVLLAKGPQHLSGVSYAKVVNAAANFWKHQGEWVAGSEGGQEASTRAVLDKLFSTRKEYVLGNVLRALVKPEDARFARLVPWLERWRDSLAAGT